MHFRYIFVRLATFLMLICMWAATPCPAQISGIVEKKLPNGLSVILKESHAAPVFTAQVWFRVGSRNEHTGITGVSHLVEHMLFNSSKNYAKGELSKLTRGKGGIENAATWTDFTYYWCLMSRQHLEFAIKALAEKTGSALFTQKELATERGIVISEKEGRENDPGMLLYESVFITAYKAHPYQWPTIGWDSDIKNMTRSQVLEHYQSYYHPNNATVVLVGDFDPKQAMKLVNKYFGVKPKMPLPVPVHTIEPPQTGERRVIVHRPGNAYRVMFAYHIPSYEHADTYPLTVLDQILSGGRSSRLYQALVETQLATSAGSNTDSRRDPGLFTLSVVGRQGVATNTLEKSLDEQVEQAKNTLPTDRELQAALNQVEASLIFQNDSVSQQGQQLGYYNTIGSWRYLQTLIPRLRKVTAAQVQAVAKKYLTDDNMTVGLFVPTDRAALGPTTSDSQISGSTLTNRMPDLCCYTNSDKTITQVKKFTVARTQYTPKIRIPARVVLDNGIVVIIQENHSNPTIAISGQVKAGGCFEPSGKQGLASMVASMLSKGTARRSALDIAKETEFVGASVSFSADAEGASLSAGCLTNDFKLILDLLSDELRNPSFPEDQLARIKGQALSRLEQEKESPDDLAYRAFANAVFPEGHPYSMPTLESAGQQISSISCSDLAAFHKSFYRPDTLVISVVGDVKTFEAVALINKAFWDWKAEGPTPKVEIPLVKHQAEPKKIVVNIPDKSEVSLLFGHASEMGRKNKDYYAFRIMNQILGGGGGTGSVLGDELRGKRGLVYGAHSAYMGTLGAGPWFAALGTSPKNTKEAVAAVQTSVAQFVKKGATKDQFLRAQQFVVGVLPITLETNDGLADLLVSIENIGLGLDYLNRYPTVYGAVTLDQVNAIARKYLHPESATLVIAGTYKE